MILEMKSSQAEQKTGDYTNVDVYEYLQAVMKVMSAVKNSW